MDSFTDDGDEWKNVIEYGEENVDEATSNSEKIINIKKLKECP